MAGTAIRGNFYLVYGVLEKGARMRQNNKKSGALRGNGKKESVQGEGYPEINTELTKSNGSKKLGPSLSVSKENKKESRKRKDELA